MFREIFNATHAEDWSSWALIIFVTVFIVVVTWTVTRKKKQIDQWASMPLDDDKIVDPKKTNLPTATPNK